jgi:hypothetical protein
MKILYLEGSQHGAIQERCRDSFKDGRRFFHHSAVKQSTATLSMLLQVTHEAPSQPKGNMSFLKLPGLSVSCGRCAAGEGARLMLGGGAELG